MLMLMNIEVKEQGTFLTVSIPHKCKNAALISSMSKDLIHSFPEVILKPYSRFTYKGPEFLRRTTTLFRYISYLQIELDVSSDDYDSLTKYSRRESRRRNRFEV